MNLQAEEITVNGVAYVPKGSVSAPAPMLDGLPYRIIRTYSAGVFAGYVKERNGKEAVLLKARRLWMWDGAATLSQLAQEGTSKPNGCKFPCEVEQVELTEVIEVISVTAKAQASIASVAVWKE